MLKISNNITLQDEEIEINAIRAQAAGGQNVNKVSSAVHLRFDIRASSLPDEIKARLLRLSDRRITKEGVLVIKAQDHRSQDSHHEPFHQVPPPDEEDDDQGWDQQAPTEAMITVPSQRWRKEGVELLV